MENSIGRETRGFTIVELLVVIVVIGILASITVISYTGLSNKAIIATLQSDLSAASKKIKVFQALSQNNDYPAAINCTNTLSTEICLTPTGNSIYTLYSYNNAVSPKTFTLEETNGFLVYRITEGTAPIAVNTTPFTAISSIVGTGSVGNVLTAGSLTPAAATVSYQWQSSTTIGGVYANISGANSNTYSLSVSDINNYIKVVAVANGSYSGTQSSTPVGPVLNNWIAGYAGTSLQGKYVMGVDLPGNYMYKTSNSSNSLPQGNAGSDLVSPQSNPGVDFSEYPAQNACKSVGGRLPVIYNELIEIQNHQAYYGGNFNTGFYWSATEYYANYSSAHFDYFATAATATTSKTVSASVRCVKD